jgi:signal transduction histidine kinase
VAISQYILNAAEEQRLQTRTRGIALVRIRYYYLVLLGVVGITSSIVAKSSSAIIVSYIIVTITGLIANAAIGFVFKSPNRTPKAYSIGAYAEIVLDIILATCVVFAQGGYPSRATILYAVPILSSGVLLLQPSAYVAAALSGAAYTFVLFTRYFMGTSPDQLQKLAAPVAFYPVAFLILAAIVTRFSAINAVNERQVSYNQLLAMLRHQLRHPASVITTIIDALEHDESYSTMNERQQQLLTQIKEENMRMNSMISNLLVAAQHRTDGQQASQAQEAINLSDLVREAARSCAMSAARIGNLNLDVEDDIEITANSGQLHMALDNIIDNAFRYSDTGTPVDIVLSKEKNFAVLTISDQGRGMSTEQLKTVFQRFEQYEDNMPSDPNKVQLYTMGLGLHVSKLIIERFSGFMEIFSEPHVGTKITIRLPRR